MAAAQPAALARWRTTCGVALACPRAVAPAAAREEWGVTPRTGLRAVQAQEAALPATGRARSAQGGWSGSRSSQATLRPAGPPPPAWQERASRWRASQSSRLRVRRWWHRQDPEAGQRGRGPQACRERQPPSPRQWPALPPVPRLVHGLRGRCWQACGPPTRLAVRPRRPQPLRQQADPRRRWRRWSRSSTAVRLLWPWVGTGAGPPHRSQTQVCRQCCRRPLDSGHLRLPPPCSGLQLLPPRRWLARMGQLAQTALPDTPPRIRAKRRLQSWLQPWPPSPRATCGLRR